MKRLALLVFVLTSFSNAFAVSEKRDVICTKMNQDSAFQETVTSAPAVQGEVPVKKNGQK